MKDKRFFLCKDADSYVNLTTPGNSEYAAYNLKMADCTRSIEWEFYANGNTPEEAEKNRKAALKKLTKFRNLINELYEELGGE